MPTVPIKALQQPRVWPFPQSSPDKDEASGPVNAGKRYLHQRRHTGERLGQCCGAAAASTAHPTAAPAMPRARPILMRTGGQADRRAHSNAF